MNRNNKTIEKTLAKKYDLDYIVVVPSIDEDLFDDFTYTFGNTIPINMTIDDADFFIKFFRQNHIKKIIFVDHIYEYEDIINSLVRETDIDFIFTHSLGELTDPEFYASFQKILDKYEHGIIGHIGILDETFYRILSRRHKQPFRQVMLDCPKLPKSYQENYTIGLLSRQDYVRHNFYNQLAAVSMLDNDNHKYLAKIHNPSPTTKSFCQTFNIKYTEASSATDALRNNQLNLYVNFTSSHITTFLRSMDQGIPCLVGNNTFLEAYPKLSRLLSVDRDDNIIAISEKLAALPALRKEALAVYRAFRSDHAKTAKELATKFINTGGK